MLLLIDVIRNLGENKARYFYGPWGDVGHLGEFDLVLTSETIYNPANYEALLTAIRTFKGQGVFCGVQGILFWSGRGDGDVHESCRGIRV